MANPDLRPLSMGEILDRTFTLYRGHFGLFIGISTIPYLLVLLLQLTQDVFTFSAVKMPQPPVHQLQGAAAPFSTGGVAAIVVFGLLAAVVSVLAYLLAQGATVLAVSELYLGRPTTIGDSFRRVRGELGTIFGVLVLSGLAMMGGFILLIIPGIYIMCRLAVAVPAALIESLGPRDSLARSFALTKDNAGRAFLIYLLYFALAYGAMMLFQFPFMIAIAASAKNPSAVRYWMVLMQMGNIASTVLITPVLTIAASVFYFDLRVRKEAFDLQMLMQPLGGRITMASSMPSILS